MIVVNKEEVKEENGHCGLIRRLTNSGPARIVHLLVKDAQRHLHKATTEYYYILNGSGQLFLDNDVIELRKGDLVKIEPGVVHQAMEKENEELEILVIEIPPAIDDVYID